MHNQATRIRRFKIRKALWQRIAKEVLYLIAGIFSAGFGLKGFLLPGHFLDGGVTGISLLLRFVTGYPLSLLLVIINIPFVLMGYRQISRTFAIKSILGIIGLAICIELVHFPVVTSDKLLIAVFGGFFIGAGSGLAMRGGGVLDGTEILSVFVSRHTVFTVGDIIAVLNVCIFSVAAFVINVETALYAMLTYLSASKTVDYLVNGIEEYVGVMIISDHSEIIRRVLIHKLGKGITIYKGRKGMTRSGQSTQELDIIYTVVTRLEVQRLNNEILQIDDKAFIVQTPVIDTKGGMIRRRPLH
ncbi:MAG: YitT family protein [Thermoflavifilum aggregans]|nr:YitT family protein [Thermoflavifilum aggregans]